MYNKIIEKYSLEIKDYKKKSHIMHKLADKVSFIAFQNPIV